MKMRAQACLAGSNQETSHLPSIGKTGFRTCDTRTHRARQAAHHQFTRPFLLITGSLPAKYIVAKGLVPHLYSAAVCRNPWFAGALGSSVGTEIDLRVDWTDSLVAQRDHGIDTGRTASGDITSQSSHAHQNNRHDGKG
ncbi:MAG: hypothetical protein QOJ42_774 [Acidobacteriaceae bacterium]|jgi:hypothetical protein|nr:hypothetical protein [Acidobacteriaceae bacterium]